MVRRASRPTRPWGVTFERQRLIAAIAAARQGRIEILLKHRMTAVYREQPRSGRVRGIAVTNNGRSLNIRARKAVVVGTGGSSGNVNFRRMFDPRLTEEYCGLAGMPWSDQDASGELAAMSVGASLWGASNYATEIGSNITKPGKIGCQYGYVNLTWIRGSAFRQGGATACSPDCRTSSGKHAGPEVLRRDRRRVTRHRYKHDFRTIRELPQSQEGNSTRPN